MIRAFVAIPAPEALIPALDAAQTGLLVGRLVPAENFHVTLAFLGDQTDRTLEEIHHALEDISLPAPVIVLKGLGVFGGRAPRALYAEVAPVPELKALRKQVRLAVRAAGVDLPHERFVPHVTLARFGKPPQGEDLAHLQHLIARRMGLVTGSALASGFALYQSLRLADGAVYDLLAEYDFAPASVGERASRP